MFNRLSFLSVCVLCLMFSNTLKADTVTFTYAGDLDFTGIIASGDDAIDLDDASFSLEFVFADTATAPIDGTYVATSAALTITDPTTAANSGTFSLVAGVDPVLSVNSFGFGGFTGTDGAISTPLVFDGPIANFQVNTMFGGPVDFISGLTQESAGTTISAATFDGATVSTENDFFLVGTGFTDPQYSTSNTSFSVTSGIPEPTSLGVLGLLGVALVSRRKRR